MVRAEVILVGLVLLARERMDMATEAVGEEVLEVEDSAHLLELEYQAGNGGGGSEFLKDHQVEVVVIQEVTGEEGVEEVAAAEEGAEEDIRHGICYLWAGCVMAFVR